MRLRVRQLRPGDIADMWGGEPWRIERTSRMPHGMVDVVAVCAVTGGPRRSLLPAETEVEVSR